MPGGPPGAPGAPGRAAAPALAISRLSQTSVYIEPLTRSSSDFFRFGSSSSSWGIGGGSGAFIFSPVHSRNAPQEPQKASVSWL